MSFRLEEIDGATNNTNTASDIECRRRPLSSPNGREHLRTSSRTSFVKACGNPISHARNSGRERFCRDQPNGGLGAHMDERLQETISDNESSNGTLCQPDITSPDDEITYNVPSEAEYSRPSMSDLVDQISIKQDIGHRHERQVELPKCNNPDVLLRDHELMMVEERVELGLYICQLGLGILDRGTPTSSQGHTRRTRCSFPGSTVNKIGRLVPTGSVSSGSCSFRTASRPASASESKPHQ